MEVTGKIKALNPEIQVSASFRKRELVVATEEQYPQFISINFVQDKCDLLDNYSIGEEVKVSINLRGREWVNPEGVTKYFNDIQGWKIERLNAQPHHANHPTNTPPQNQAAPQDYKPAYENNDDEHDDLPF